ncbi:MAG: clostripain-related cysteine peptidase [Verrucomicrobiota bacterium]
MSRFSNRHQPVAHQDTLMEACKHTFRLLVWLAGTSLTLAQEIPITSPPAGAQLPIGRRCSIVWDASGLTGQPLEIKLLSPGAEFIVADQVPSEAGQYQWDIPWECPATNPCHIVLTCAGASAQNWSGPEFAIVTNSEPTLIVRSPAGGEHWPRGTTRSVAWESHNLTGDLTLELLSEGAVVDSVSGLASGERRGHYMLPASRPTGTNYAIRLTSMQAPGATVTSGTFRVTDTPPARKPWTILLYMDGDNNLEPGGLADLADLGTLGSTSNLNLLVQMDRAAGYVTNDGNWYDTRRFYVNKGTTAAPEHALQQLGELDMASPHTLTDFINWGAENYPAERYLLICCDHGDDVLGLLEDWTPTHRQMSTRQFQQALETADARMAIVGLDMCQEGYAEVAHQLRNTGTEILVFSQYEEDRNWPYRAVFQQLDQRQGRMDNCALAILLCEAGVAKYPVNQAGTLTAVRLDQMAAFSDRMATFADAMIAEVNARTTIQAAADTVIASFHQAVLCCAHNSATEYFVNGLNVFFPPAAGPRTDLYTPALQDFAADGHWQAFLTNYHDHLSDTWIGEARQRVSAPGGDDKVDVLRFLQAISPDTNNAWVSFAIVGDGNVEPGGNSSIMVRKGQALPIVATANIMGLTTNHFVRWWVSGDARIDDSLAPTNTVVVYGDAAVMAIFCENKESYQVTFLAQGNGRFNGTNEFTVEVPAGDACSPVTATEAPGYTFSAWGGDYAATVNPLILTNVQTDMTVIGFFWPVPPVLSIHLDRTTISLAWPIDPVGYVLEVTGNLAAGPWLVVPGVVNNSATLPRSATSQFYRLHGGTDQIH